MERGEMPGVQHRLGGRCTFWKRRVVYNRADMTQERVAGGAVRDSTVR